MIKKILFSLCVLLSVVCVGDNHKAVKVACVGDSVTYGSKIENREECSYPSVLQQMLGNGFDVENFGKPGATLLCKGHRPYVEQQEYADALAFRPDIVVIHLGVNDTDPRNWPARICFSILLTLKSRESLLN